MPTYDYQCQSCGESFEQFQSITAKPLKKCPHCQANALQRLIGTGGGLIFKGSGFYQTDYRSDAYKKSAAAESGSKTDSKATSTDAATSKNSKTEPAKSGDTPKSGDATRKAAV